MEPLTTFALLVSLASAPVTLRPNWKTERRAEVHKSLPTTTPAYIETAELETREFAIPKVVASIEGNFSADVYSILSSYALLDNGWDGPDSVPALATDVERAMDFLDSLPSAFPLPRPMLSPKGEVGLYWDNELTYADIQFERNGTASLFIRDRMTEQEQFHDELVVEKLTSDWYFDVLGSLAHSYTLAA